MKCWKTWEAFRNLNCIWRIQTSLIWVDRRFRTFWSRPVFRGLLAQGRWPWKQDTRQGIPAKEGSRSKRRLGTKRLPVIWFEILGHYRTGGQWWRISCGNDWWIEVSIGKREKLSQGGLKFHSFTSCGPKVEDWILRLGWCGKHHHQLRYGKVSEKFTFEF